MHQEKSLITEQRDQFREGLHTGADKEQVQTMITGYGDRKQGVTQVLEE